MSVEKEDLTTIQKFMEDKTEFEVEGTYTLKKLKNGVFTFSVPVKDEDDISNIMEAIGKEIRFCSVCGAPMRSGYTNEDCFYACGEKCFTEDMDKDYGKGNWRATSDEGENGGFYESKREDGTWQDTGIYYTEWE